MASNTQEKETSLDFKQVKRKQDFLLAGKFGLHGTQAECGPKLARKKKPH